MDFDFGILNWIRENLICGFLDFLMPKITLLGDLGLVWIVTAIVLICIKKYRRYGILLLLGLGIGVLIGNVALKHIVARPRPCWINPDIQLLIENPGDFSFPSGHTLSSVIGATILTMTNRKFGFAAIPVAAIIAFSRLYLYVHFPSDVLGAAFLGIIIGVAVFYSGRKICDRFTAKVQNENPEADT